METCYYIPQGSLVTIGDAYLTEARRERRRTTLRWRSRCACAHGYYLEVNALPSIRSLFGRTRHHVVPSIRGRPSDATRPGPSVMGLASWGSSASYRRVLSVEVNVVCPSSIAFTSWLSRILCLATSQALPKKTYRNSQVGALLDKSGPSDQIHHYAPQSSIVRSLINDARLNLHIVFSTPLFFVARLFFRMRIVHLQDGSLPSSADMLLRSCVRCDTTHLVRHSELQFKTLINDHRHQWTKQRRPLAIRHQRTICRMTLTEGPTVCPRVYLSMVQKVYSGLCVVLCGNHFSIICYIRRQLCNIMCDAGCPHPSHRQALFPTCYRPIGAQTGALSNRRDNEPSATLDDMSLLTVRRKLKPSPKSIRGALKCMLPDIRPNSRVDNQMLDPLVTIGDAYLTEAHRERRRTTLRCRSR
nr:hypothetical protein [Tanacetum cinerariifolium]